MPIREAQRDEHLLMDLISNAATPSRNIMRQCDDNFPISAPRTSDVASRASCRESLDEWKSHHLLTIVVLIAVRSIRLTVAMVTLSAENPPLNSACWRRFRKRSCYFQ